MKRYVYEADRKQWEKPTEPKYICCATAKAVVIAETEEEAKALAEKKLHDKYYQTGILLGEARKLREDELPVDWSYGYGDERKSGLTKDLGDLVGNHVIRD